MGVDGSYASNVPAFLTKLWTLVEDPDTNHLICWSTVSQTVHDAVSILSHHYKCLFKPDRAETMEKMKIGFFYLHASCLIKILCHVISHVVGDANKHDRT